MRNRIIGIVGMRGHGKSTLLRELVDGASKMLIIDTLVEHSDPDEDALWKALPVLSNSYLDAIHKIETNKFDRHALLLPPVQDHQQIVFEYYCKAAFAAAVRYKQPVFFVIEEADWFSNPNWENEGLTLLIQYGRHGPVNLIWTARNIGAVSRKLTSETDAYFLFHIQEPGWLDSLGERLGVDVADRVKLLQPQQYITVKTGGLWGAHAEGKETE